MLARHAFLWSSLIALIVCQPMSAQSGFARGELAVSTSHPGTGNPGNGVVYVFNPAGTLQGGVAGSFAGNPRVVAFNPSLKLYVGTQTLVAAVTEIYDSRLALPQQLPIKGVAFAFNAAGEFFVAPLEGERIDKYSSSGGLLQSFSLPNRYPTALALSGDGCSLFYFDNGGFGRLARFDVCTSTPGVDVVASAPGLDGAPRSLRLLPDGTLLLNAGDGTTGGRAVRYAPDGSVLRTYEIPGLTDTWMAIALTADGTEMWAALSGGFDGPGGRLYRVNVASGAVVAGPFMVPGTLPITSMAVAGEYQAAVGVAPPIPTLSVIAGAVVIALMMVIALRQLG
jgi:hypothetical protein